jgi:hypothetical protein
MLEEPDFSNSIAAKTINKKSETHDYNTNGHFKIEVFPFSLRFAQKPATPVAKV